MFTRNVQNINNLKQHQINLFTSNFLTSGDSFELSTKVETLPNLNRKVCTAVASINNVYELL